MAENGEMEIDSVPHAEEPVRSVEGWIIIVTNLHEEMSEEDLQDSFSDFGSIKNLHLNLDRRSGFVKGYALIEYAEKEQAEQAIAEAHGSMILEHKVNVGFAFIAPPKLAEQASTTTKDRSQSPERRPDAH